MNHRETLVKVEHSDWMRIGVADVFVADSVLAGARDDDEFRARGYKLACAAVADRLRPRLDRRSDLTAQRVRWRRAGVTAERIYVDHGLTGANRERPGLREALAACRGGDTLVVTKLDRLARSLPDARQILEDLTHREVKLSLGGSVHDPSDPVGRLLFNVLAMVAEFEADLVRLPAREGMKVAKAKGRLRGKQPKLKPRQEAHLIALHHAGEHSTAELGDLFGVAHSTVHRAIQRGATRTRAITRGPATNGRR